MWLQLEQKRDEGNVASTIARNEYLLMLSAANVHQRRYYETDMPEAMRVSHSLCSYRMSFMRNDVFDSIETETYLM